MSSPVLKLPTELLAAIFENLHTWDQYSLMLTCKYFSKVAKSQLWEKINISIEPWAYLQYSRGDMSLDEMKSIVRVPIVLLKQLAKSPTAKSIKILRMTNLGEARVRLIGIDNEGTNWLQKPVGKLFRNLDPLKLTLLHSDFDFLEGVERFINLRVLRVAVSYNQLTYQKPYSLPIMSSIEQFGLSWDLGKTKKVSSAYLNFLSLFCSFAALFPRVRHLICTVEDLQAVAQKVPDLRTLRKGEDSIYRFTRSLKLKDFKILELWAPQAFYQTPFEINMSDKSQKDLDIFRVFAGFLTRHKDQLQTLMWFDTEEKQSMATANRGIFPAFSAMRKISLALGDTHMNNNDRSVARRYLQALTMKTDNRLQYLKLANFVLDKGWQLWMTECILPLKNLVKLKLIGIHPTYLLQPDIDIRFGPPEERNHGIFRDWEFYNFTDLLPTNLQKLTVAWWSFDRFPADEYDCEKKSALVFFEKLRSLCWLKLVCKSTSLMGINNTQSLIFRRRARDYSDPSLGKKKVCIWHLEPCHGHDDLQYSSHPKVYSYAEYFLPEQQYQGCDAPKWDFNRQYEAGLKQIRHCGLAGEHGCAYLLSAKGVWVPLPDENVISAI